jgi:hypothetical protein
LQISYIEFIEYTWMPSFIRKAALISPFSRKPIIILREPFVIFFNINIPFVKNITLVSILQVITDRKFVSFLKILVRKAIGRYLLFSKSWV